MLDLESAIKHCYEVAESLGCTECAKDHRQLAEWLKELKAYKEQQKIGRWISVSERLPEIHQEVLVMMKNGVNIGFRGAAKPCFYCYGYAEPQNVLAWMSLPDMYKPDEDGAKNECEKNQSRDDGSGTL